MDKKDFDGLLVYLIDNCVFAYEQLCEVNKKLNEEISKIKEKDFSSSVDINHLGAMNRMIQDYLVLRVAGLFDPTKYPRGGIDEVVSFEKTYLENEIYKKAKEKEIIKYIIDRRHNFVAHMNGDFIPPDSAKICDSDLKEILLILKTMVG